MSNTVTEKKHEPLFHVVKREGMPMLDATLIRLGSVVAALLVCAIVTMALTGENPIKVYATMIDGAFGTSRRVWNLLQSLAMLLCVSLAVTPAFKMRFWNIGAEGQVLIGGLASAACMILFGNSLPNWLLIVTMIVASVVAGAVWALIPAVFKAYLDTNETLFTLMMNYVGIQLVAYFARVWENPKGSGSIGVINAGTEAGWFPAVAGQKYFLNIVIVLALTIFMYIYLKYSKHGYEIAVVGESQNTARYIGLNVRKVRRHEPHDYDGNRRWTRLYRDYGVVACEVQPDCDDSDGAAPLLLRGGRATDCDGVRTQQILLRYSDGYHSLLHYRKRILRQLSD